MPYFHNDTSEKNIFVPIVKSKFNLELEVKNYAINKLNNNKETLGNNFDLSLLVKNYGIILHCFMTKV